MSKSIFQVLERNTRSITLLDALRSGFEKPSVLFQDYTSSKPIVEVFSAFANGHSLLGCVMLTSSATALYTVLLGALQVSASFYGATTFASDLACAIATLFLNACFLLVSVAVGWRYSRRRFLERSPGTMAAMMPFVLSSEKLKEDIRMIRLKDSRREKIKCLEDHGRRYGFGHFHNASEPNTKHFGVERNETNARPDGRPHILA